jgi:tripeptidyl-peptidase-1
MITAFAAYAEASILVPTTMISAFAATEGEHLNVVNAWQSRTHWTKLPDAVPPFTPHEVVFAVKHANLDTLEHELLARSTPGNIKFGKHLSFDEVGAIVSTTEPATRVLSWLAAAMPQHELVRSTPRGEYLRVSATVAALEAALHTTFAYYRSSRTGKVALRCEKYELPRACAADVAAIFKTVDFPPTMRPVPSAKKLGDVAANATSGRGRALQQPTNLITPATLNAFYKVDSNFGSKAVSQAVFESLGQNYSPENLVEFQQQFGLSTSYQVSTDVGGHASSLLCEVEPNSCTEANLDVQYMMALSQDTPMTYYYEDDGDDPFLAFAEAIAAEKAPPLVNSISYGSIEVELPKETMEAFNTEVMKLGAMGVSVFVSSGDDGVANFLATTPSLCSYSPSYPASSPYVTAVGATYATSWDTPGKGEIVQQSNVDDAVITSGGGFSTAFAAPAYQKQAVADYFASVQTPPAKGYAASGRGYPDVSLSGFGYEVVIGEAIYIVCGTSASAPSVAAMASLVNAIRVEAGASTLGFLNPALYAAGTSSGVFNDVTEGENQCTANGAVCCKEGFYAAKGWDPATGFGSVDYAAFKAQMVHDLDGAAVRAAEARLVARL